MNGPNSRPKKPNGKAASVPSAAPASARRLAPTRFAQQAADDVGRGCECGQHAEHHHRHPADLREAVDPRGEQHAAEHRHHARNARQHRPRDADDDQAERDDPEQCRVHAASIQTGRFVLEGGRSPFDADQRLAEVLAAHQAAERGGCGAQAFDDVFAVREPALAMPGEGFLQELLAAVLVVVDHQRQDPAAAGHQRPEVRPGWRVLQVVLRDQPAEDHARAHREVPSADHEVLQFAAGVVEEHVHALGRELAQPRVDVLALVVDAGVEARLAPHPVALRLEPAMPIARAPLRRAICPTMQPTGPEAAETSTVSPARSCATSSRPKYAVMPGTPRMPSAVEAGTCPGCSRQASAPSETAVLRSPVSSQIRSPTSNTSLRDSITRATAFAGITSPGCGMRRKCRPDSSART